MLIFNANALIAVGLGAAGGFALGSFIAVREVAVLGAIIIAMAVDVWMRFNSEDCDRPLIAPSAGGHVWFVPVWLAGIAVMVLMGLSYFQVI